MKSIFPDLECEEIMHIVVWAILDNIFVARFHALQVAQSVNKRKFSLIGNFGAWGQAE